jgi:endonuclease III
MSMSADREQAIDRLMPRAASTRLGRILDALEAHYGAPRATKPARPYDLLVFAMCGYPASDAACTKGLAALTRSIGTSPRAILAAPKRKLVEAMREGGIVPELRADRLREIVKRTTTEPGADPNAIAKLPIAKARKLLKTFPTIGDPGADKVLLLSHVAPIAAVPSNATQVPLRLGFGTFPREDQSSYAKSYRSAQAALDAELPREISARVRAYVLLKKHGEAICKRSRPQCPRCPIARDCPYPDKTPSV